MDIALKLSENTLGRMFSNSYFTIETRGWCAKS